MGRINKHIDIIQVRAGTELQSEVFSMVKRRESSSAWEVREDFL